ncbi:MAG: hypothetical protein ABIL16_08085 [candidate division WOR-3 bacterium]
MPFGFLPIFSIYLPDTLNPLSLYFDNGNAYIGTAEGVIMVNNNEFVKINNPVMSLCKSKAGVWALTPYKIRIFGDNGEEITNLKFPESVKTLRCYQKGVYITTENRIVYIPPSSAPRAVVSGWFADALWSGDTLYLLSDYAIKFFYNGKVRTLLNLRINTSAIRFEKFDRWFFVLDGDNWLWVADKMGATKIITADNFTTKGDTLILFRRERFGNFIYVLKILRYGEN